MKHRSRRPPAQPDRPAEKRRELQLLAYGALILAVLIYFWKILIGENFLWEDILYQYYPFHYFLFSQLRQLNIPLWNPYMFAGMPFLADIQTQVFYPLNWLLALFASSNQRLVFWLVELKCILHILLGGIGFYLLMRELKTSPLGALLSAITFALSAFMIMHVIHLTLISAFAWFPIILLFFYRTINSRRLRDAIAGGTILGIANLAGHPQMTLHIVYSLALLFLIHTLTSWRSERRLIFTSRLPLFLLTILTGFALAACAYLPSYNYSRHTVRELMTYAESAELSLPPSFLITLFIPKFFGSITGTGTDTIEYWANPAAYSYWETAAYLGIVPLFFAIVGISFSRHRLRWHFMLLAALALLLALGKYTPLYRLAFEILPGFDRFRIPARFINLFTVAIAFFAGQGMDTLLSARRPEKQLLAPGIGVLAYLLLLFTMLLTGVFNRLFPNLNISPIFNNAFQQTLIALGLTAATLLLSWLTLRTRTNRPVYATMLIALTFIDLYQFGHRFNLGSVTPESFYPRRPFIDRLVTENREIPFRINARAGQYMVLQRNEGLIWQLELLEGYTPLKLTDYVTFDLPQERRNNLLNVRYQIKVDSISGTAGLTLNPDALPRVWLTDTFVVVTDRPQILSLLSQPDFDYRRVAVLEKHPDPRPVPDSGTLGSVTIIRRQPEHLVLQAELNRPALLLLSEIFYPEWRATVDGQPVEILRADYCLRAVALSRGNHEIVFYYDRRLVDIGIVISLLTMILAVGIFTGPLLLRKNKGSVRHSSTTGPHR